MKTLYLSYNEVITELWMNNMCWLYGLDQNRLDYAVDLYNGCVERMEEGYAPSLQEWLDAAGLPIVVTAF